MQKGILICQYLKTMIEIKFLDGPLAGISKPVNKNMIIDNKVMWYQERPFQKCIYNVKEDNGVYTATFSHNLKSKK